MGDVTSHFEPQLLWFQTPIVARPCQCKLHQKALSRASVCSMFYVLCSIYMGTARCVGSPTGR